MSDLKPTVFQLLCAVRAQYEDQIPSTLPEDVRKAAIDVMMAFQKELLIHAAGFEDSENKEVFLEVLCDLMMGGAIAMLTQTSASAADIEARIAFYQGSVRVTAAELPKDLVEVKERLGLSGDPPRSPTH